MKHHYLSLWLLLLCAFAVFAISSAFDMPYLGSHRLRSSGIADALTPPLSSLSFPSEEAPSLSLQEPKPSQNAQEALSLEGTLSHPAVKEGKESGKAAENTAPADTASHTILLIGDSMLEGIAPRLAAYAEHNGHTLYSVMWYSSTSKVWGSSDRLRGYISRLQPTFIIVCLGANELNVRDIAERRGKYVRRIVDDIDTIPYLWIGPPNWRRDTGINDLIRATTAPGTFFLSDGMDFERTADGAHPTRTSAALWVDSVMRWMPANARYPIRMDEPEIASARPRRVFVHKPSEQ